MADSFGNPKVTTGQQTGVNSAPVVLASDQTLPLPTGAATAANQATEITSLANIDTKTPALVGGRQPVDGSGVTQPISATALPLPSGAATSANQTTEITSLQLIDDVPTAQNGPLVKGNPIMGQLDDTGTTAATEDNVAAVRITAQRAVHTNLRDASGNEITSASDGNAGNRLLHTQTPDTTTVTTTLGALNATVSVGMAGLSSVGFQLNAGTLIGTLVPEASIDGGTTWTAASFLNQSTNTVSTSLVFASSNTLTIYSIIPINGASHTRVRVSAYTSGTANSLMRASNVRGPNSTISTVQLVSALPAATITSDLFISPGTTLYTAYTAAQNLALKQFFVGGTGVGKQSLFRYAPSTTQLISNGDFESSGDVTNWPWVSTAGTGSVAFSTAQHFTNAGSAAVTFTNSAGTSAQGIKRTFSSPQDLSGWRYVTAQFFNVVSAGGAYTRTISIILTDSATSTQKYDLSGLSTASPFNASNWIKITGEILNPTSFTGTGFDLTQVVSIELRMTDSGNKAGTVYWDTAQLEAQLTLISPVFHYANTSFNLPIDPVAVLTTGNQIVIQQTNNDTTRKEFFALIGGVAL